MTWIGGMVSSNTRGTTGLLSASAYPTSRRTNESWRRVSGVTQHNTTSLFSMPSSSSALKS